MCFSASASFVTGTALTGIGSATAKQAPKKELIPYALIPLLFGVQQISEGFLWLAINHEFPGMQVFMTYLFTLFSHVLWPVYVPLAVLKMEHVYWRRLLMSVCLVLGVAVSLLHLATMVMYPVTASVVGHSLVYEMPRYYLNFVVVCYLLATCAAPLVSSHRLVRWFGLALLASASISYLAFAAAFVSVWCFFAAGLSALIYLFIAGQSVRSSSYASVHQRV